MNPAIDLHSESVEQKSASGSSSEAVNTVRHWSLFWTNWVKSVASYTKSAFKGQFIFTFLSTIVLTSGHFPSGFLTTALSHGVAFHSCHITGQLHPSFVNPNIFWTVTFFFFKISKIIYDTAFFCEIYIPVKMLVFPICMFEEFWVVHSSLAHDHVSCVRVARNSQAVECFDQNNEPAVLKK